MTVQTSGWQRVETGATGYLMRAGAHERWPHIQLRFYRFHRPEELVVLWICTSCGRRFEVLVAQRGHGPGRGVPRGEDIMFGWDEWVEEHTICETSPTPPEFPGRVRHSAGALARLLEQRIGRGVLTRDYLVLLTADDRVFTFYHTNPSRVFGYSSVEELAPLLVKARRVAREQAVIAAIGCTEVIERSGEERGVVVVTTPSAGALGEAPIRRLGGVPGEGPGELGRMVWRALGEEVPLVDGVLALPYVGREEMN